MNTNVAELNRLYLAMQAAKRGSGRLIRRVSPEAVKTATQQYEEALGAASDVDAAIHILQRDHGKIS